MKLDPTIPQAVKDARQKHEAALAAQQDADEWVRETSRELRESSDRLKKHIEDLIEKGLDDA